MSGNETANTSAGAGRRRGATGAPAVESKPSSSSKSSTSSTPASTTANIEAVSSAKQHEVPPKAVEGKGGTPRAHMKRTLSSIYFGSIRGTGVKQARPKLADAFGAVAPESTKPPKSSKKSQDKESPTIEKKSDSASDHHPLSSETVETPASASAEIFEPPVSPNSANQITILGNPGKSSIVPFDLGTLEDGTSQQSVDLLMNIPRLPALTKIAQIFQIAGFEEQEVWEGHPEVFHIITHFEAEIRASERYSDTPLRILMPQTPDFQGIESRDYQVDKTWPISKVIRIILKKMQVTMPQDQFCLSTLKDFALDAEKCLADYGLGSLFRSWQLNLAFVSDIEAKNEAKSESKKSADAAASAAAKKSKLKALNEAKESKEGSKLKLTHKTSNSSNTVAVNLSDLKPISTTTSSPRRIKSGTGSFRMKSSLGVDEGEAADTTMSGEADETSGSEGKHENVKAATDETASTSSSSSSSSSIGHSKHSTKKDSSLKKGEADSLTIEKVEKAEKADKEKSDKEKPHKEKVEKSEKGDKAEKNDKEKSDKEKSTSDKSEKAEKEATQSSSLSSSVKKVVKKKKLTSQISSEGNATSASSSATTTKSTSSEKKTRPIKKTSHASKSSLGSSSASIAAVEKKFETLRDSKSTTSKSSPILLVLHNPNLFSSSRIKPVKWVINMPIKKILSAFLERAGLRSQMSHFVLADLYGRALHPNATLETYGVGNKIAKWELCLVKIDNPASVTQLENSSFAPRYSWVKNKDLLPRLQVSEAKRIIIELDSMLHSLESSDVVSQLKSTQNELKQAQSELSVLKDTEQLFKQFLGEKFDLTSITDELKTAKKVSAEAVKAFEEVKATNIQLLVDLEGERMSRQADIKKISATHTAEMTQLSEYSDALFEKNKELVSEMEELRGDMFDHRQKSKQTERERDLAREAVDELTTKLKNEQFNMTSVTRLVDELRAALDAAKEQLAESRSINISQAQTIAHFERLRHSHPELKQLMEDVENQEPEQNEGQENPKNPGNDSEEEEVEVETVQIAANVKMSLQTTTHLNEVSSSGVGAPQKASSAQVAPKPAGMTWAAIAAKPKATPTVTSLPPPPPPPPPPAIISPEASGSSKKPSSSPSRTLKASISASIAPNPSKSGGHTSLVDAIAGGQFNLKKAPPRLAPVQNARTSMLTDILGFSKDRLKKAAPIQKAAKEPDGLARALYSRFVAMGEVMEDIESLDDDEDWEMPDKSSNSSSATHSTTTSTSDLPRIDMDDIEDSDEEGGETDESDEELEDEEA